MTQYDSNPSGWGRGLTGFCRTKLHPWMDRLLIGLLMIFAVTSVAFPHGLSDIPTALIVIVWLFKLLTGGVKFRKDLLVAAIAVAVSMVVFSYLKYNGLTHNDYTQRQIVPPLIWYLVVSTMNISRKQARWYMSLTVLSMVALVGYLLFGQPHAAFSPENRLTFWGHPTIFSNYLALFSLSIFVFLLRERVVWKRWIYVGLMIPLAIGLLFTYARGGWVSLVLGMIFIFFYMRDSFVKGRAKLVYFGLSVVMIGLPLLNQAFAARLLTTAVNGSDQDRFLIWQSAIKMFQRSPIFGVGLNMYHYYYGKINHVVAQDTAIHAHNIWLQFLAELGLVGFFVFGFLFFALYRTAVKLKTVSTGSFQVTLLYIFLGGLTIMMIHGLFDYSINMRQSWYYLMTLLGMAVALQKTDTRPADLEPKAKIM